MTPISRFNRSIAGLFAVVFFLMSGTVQAQTQTHVCLETSLGNVCIELFPQNAPLNVANFLNYVNDGDLDGSFIHRSVPGFVIQGGGFIFSSTTGTVEDIPDDGPVVNEFARSNIRGTIAMAKTPGNPDSATNEWFINLANNSANLDTQNGGFTVFGQVIGNGMDIVDVISTRTIRDLSSTLGSPFAEVPVLKIDSNLSSDDFVTIFRAYATTADNLPDDSESPVATGTFTGITLTMPVQYRGKLYRMLFDQIGTAPNFSFALRSTQIVQLNDIGQDRAMFSSGMITIPTVIYGAKIYRNLVLQLTNAQTLEFSLASYDRP